MTHPVRFLKDHLSRFIIACLGILAWLIILVWFLLDEVQYWVEGSVSFSGGAQGRSQGKGPQPSFPESTPDAPERLKKPPQSYPAYSHVSPTLFPAIFVPVPIFPRSENAGGSSGTGGNQR